VAAALVLDVAGGLQLEGGVLDVEVADQVHKILHNRYYLGRVTFSGVEYPGRHEPLIDETTFDVVQALLASRNLAGDKPQTRPHPLKGTIYCGRCGRRFGIVYANGHGGQYPTSTVSVGSRTPMAASRGTSRSTGSRLPSPSGGRPTA
jgi:hypothetical protein